MSTSIITKKWGSRQHKE